MADDLPDLDTGLPARIAADAAALAPMTLSVARRLPAWADADGIVRPDHRKLARELHTDAATIVGALKQLVRRKHLIAEPSRDGYRFAAVLPRRPPRPRVVPFPRRHDRGFVGR
jgi:hypothetical protein